MAEDVQHRKVRKGTKSCTECRRRKVKCTWSSDDAPVCRRCEERGSTCVAQMYSSAPVRERKFTSRERIAHLENKVASLTKAVRGIETKLGHQHTETPESPPPMTATMHDGPDSEDDSGSDSDVFPSARPRHLDTMFRNDWISSHKDPINSVDERPKPSSHHLNVTRSKLQELVPSRDNIRTIASYASKWLRLQQALFPVAHLYSDAEDLLIIYDTMLSPTVDVVELSQWLSAVALTAQQVPSDQGSPSTQALRFQSAAQFCRAVCDLILKEVFNNDVLIGTLKGLTMSMFFLRLQLSFGSFIKVWLNARRIMAVAELLGLPRIAKSVRSGKTKITGENDPNFMKTQVWEGICGMDRMASMIFNTPVSTQRYDQPSLKNRQVLINGQVQLPVYMGTLAELAIRIQDLDELSTDEGDEPELYNAVMKIDSELRALASIPPPAWWNGAGGGVQPESHVQFWQYFIMMRNHLPFVLRNDPGGKYSYSRKSGMDACRTLLQRYMHLRSSLPPGFFVCKPLDIQAFTAAVVLLLATYSLRMESEDNEPTHAVDTKLLIQQVIDLMREKAVEPISFEIARRGAQTIQSMYDFLLEDSDPALDLAVKVPILGLIHVHRNPSITRPSLAQAAISHVQQGSPASWQTNIPVSSSLTSTGTPEASMAGITASDAWASDPFSWSIVNGQEAFFQDSFSTSNLDQYGSMQMDQALPPNWLGSSWPGYS